LAVVQERRRARSAASGLNCESDVIYKHACIVARPEALYGLSFVIGGYI
jgi:hypothetical protein